MIFGSRADLKAQRRSWGPKSYNAGADGGSVAVTTLVCVCLCVCIVCLCVFFNVYVCASLLYNQVTKLCVGSDL